MIFFSFFLNFTVSFSVDGILYTPIGTYDQKLCVSVSGLKDQSLKIITIPETVVNPENSKTYQITSIRYGAFQSTGIQSITLPQNLITIQSFAFSKCASLKSINFPQNLQKIGSHAFEYCSSLKGDLIFPDSITTIGKSAFSNSGYDGTISFPKLLTEINEKSFANMINIKGDINLPKMVIKIHDFAFSNSLFDGRINFSPRLISIGNQAFSECTKLIGNIDLPQTCTSIGNYSFFDCISLNGTISISSLSLIPQYAFSNLKNIHGDIVFSPTLTVKIKEYAFAHSNFDGNLVNFLSVSDFGANSFKDCQKLHCHDMNFSLSRCKYINFNDGCFENCILFNGTLTLTEYTTLRVSSFHTTSFSEVYFIGYVDYGTCILDENYFGPYVKEVHADNCPCDKFGSLPIYGHGPLGPLYHNFTIAEYIIMPLLFIILIIILIFFIYTCCYKKKHLPTSNESEVSLISFLLRK